MARTPTVPEPLTNGPFTLQEALSAGVTLSALRSKPWRRVGKAMYCWEHARDDPWLLIQAWKRALGPIVTFGGYTAAWMHGMDCYPTNPVEVILPQASPVRSCHGLAVRHCQLREDDVVEIEKLPATNVLRTLRDLCLARSPVDALIVLDMAVRGGLADRRGLWRYAHDGSGLPGAGRMRRLAALAEPAESPMETRLRWVLLRASLARPEVQKDLRDGDGRFLGRADLYYRSARLVVEFDGGNHRERLVSDDRRQNLLVNAGFTVLRFTSADLHGRPHAVVAQVRGALASPDSARIAQNAQNTAA